MRGHCASGGSPNTRVGSLPRSPFALFVGRSKPFCWRAVAGGGKANRPPSASFCTIPREKDAAIHLHNRMLCIVISCLCLVPAAVDRSSRVPLLSLSSLLAPLGPTPLTSSPFSPCPFPPKNGRCCRHRRSVAQIQPKKDTHTSETPHASPIDRPRPTGSNSTLPPSSRRPGRPLRLLAAG